MLRLLRALFLLLLASSVASKKASTIHKSSHAASKRASTTATTSSVASTASPPPAASVEITSINTTGTGCPSNEVSISLSTDLTTVTLGFDEFDAYIGPGVNASLHTLWCLVRLAVRYPSGYTFSVLDSTYHGFAQLDAGVTGSFASVYAFLNADTGALLAAYANVTTVTALVGGGNLTTGVVYTVEEIIPTAKVIKSPCGQTVDLLVLTTISLTSTDPDAEGELTDDDATFDFTQGVGVGWATCS